MNRLISLSLSVFLTLSSILPISGQKKPDEVAAVDGFGDVSVFSGPNGNLITWDYRGKETLGFLVHRIERDRKTQVGSNIVPGPMLKPGNDHDLQESFGIFDGKGNATSAYVIESISDAGTVSASPVTRAEAVTDLSAASGGEFDALINRRDNFNGIVRTDELNLSKTTASQRERVESAADLDTHRWVVGQPGVKIGANAPGIYRVSRASLQANGFDVNTDPANWRLFSEGVEHALLVGPNADYIEFYGTGIDVPESDTRMYYLIGSTSPGLRMGSRVASRMRSTVSSKNYAQTFSLKERTMYISDILNGETENYFGRYIWTTTTPLNFELTGVDFNAPTADITIKFYGYGPSAHSVTPNLNGNALATVSAQGQLPFSGVYSVPTSYLREGTNTLNMVSSNSNEYSFFDSITINFNRKFLAQQNQLSFYTRNYRSAEVEGFTSPNVRLFEISSENVPTFVANANVRQSGASYTLTAPQHRAGVYYAVEDSAVRSATVIAPNVPSSLASAAHDAAFLIVSYKDWMAEAETWANYRRQQGFVSKVVNIEDIADEFGYGVLTAQSLKSFLLYAKANWQTPPQYVLLLGDTSYDPRRYENLGSVNYVPTMFVTTLFGETPSDDAMADANGDGVAEMGLGRMAVRNGLAVTQSLAKVMQFEQPAMQSLGRGSVFAYDLFDAGNNYDFQAISGRIRDKLIQSAPPQPPLPTPVMVGRGDVNAQATLIAAMNTGKYIINYSGHGTSGAWAASNFFANSTVPSLTNADNRSIYTMLTCLNGYFVMLENRVSLAENLTQSQNGGAIAVFSSSGLTVPIGQEQLATRFYEQIGLGNLTRIGDLTRDAKAAVVGGADVKNSYVLIGDPMLKVR